MQRLSMTTPAVPATAKRAVLALIALCFSVVSAPSIAAPPSVLIEACNGLKNAVKKAQCLKEAGATNAPASVASAPLGAPKVDLVGPINLEAAVTACETVMTGLVKRHNEAVEDSAESNDRVFAVTWPGVEGRQANYCTVDRQTRKIVSIGKGATALVGEKLAAIIAESEATAKMLAEIKAGNYGNFVQYAKTALAADFKDPNSAQYRGLFLSGDALPVLCGEVNAKNSYGAYVGFQRFYATGKKFLNSVEKARGDDVFEKMWPSMCGQPKASIDSP